MIIMVMTMSLTFIHPIALDGLAVLLVAPLTESLSVDEQAVVGAFFNVLGDLLALNSSYLSFFLSFRQQIVNPMNKTQTLKKIIRIMSMIF